MNTNLPHSLESEMSVLGGILAFPGRLSEVDLQVDDFLLPAHRDIFEAMLGLDRRGRAPDVIEVEDTLNARGATVRHEPGYLMRLLTAHEIPELMVQRVAAVKNKSILRQVIAACLDAAEQAKGAADAGDVLDRLGSALARVSSLTADSMVHVGEALPSVLDALEQRSKAVSGVTGVATGIRELDAQTGGFHPEELVVIAARPGVGKTALATQIATNHALHGGAACIFSLEMSTAQLIERQLVNLTRIDQGLVKRGAVADLWEQINAAGGRLCASKIWLDDRAFSIRQIVANARRWRNKIGDAKGVIVVDYLQLAEGQSGQPRERTIANISLRLKHLAKELKVPVLAVSQLNRKSEQEDREPMLSDLRESGAIEQDADVVIFLYNKEQTKDGPVEIILAKHRNGERGKFECHWMGKNFLFSDERNWK